MRTEGVKNNQYYDQYFVVFISGGTGRRVLYFIYIFPYDLIFCMGLSREPMRCGVYDIKNEVKVFTGKAIFLLFHL